MEIFNINVVLMMAIRILVFLLFLVCPYLQSSADLGVLSQVFVGELPSEESLLNTWHPKYY